MGIPIGNQDRKVAEEEDIRKGKGYGGKRFGNTKGPYGMGYEGYEEDLNVFQINGLNQYENEEVKEHEDKVVIKRCQWCPPLTDSSDREGGSDNDEESDDEEGFAFTPGFKK